MLKTHAPGGGHDVEDGFPAAAADGPAFLLDRLRGLEKVIPGDVPDQALSECGLDRRKACRLSHRVMLWVVIAMGLLTHRPIRQVFKHARRRRMGEAPPPRRGGFP